MTMGITMVIMMMTKTVISFMITIKTGHYDDDHHDKVQLLYNRVFETNNSEDVWVGVQSSSIVLQSHLAKIQQKQEFL